MIIHIFTGSKGGIGKTRSCISTSIYYLLGGVDKPVLKNLENRSKAIRELPRLNVYDANSNNIDFFTIMTGKDFQTLTEDGVGGTNYIKKGFIDINYNDRRLPIDGYAYIRKEPFELFKGISDFWESVSDVTELINEKKEKNRKEVLIVDTNLSVPNLVSKDPDQKMKMKGAFRKFRELDVTHIIIWYIWCLNDFLSIRENLTFRTSQKIELLEKICELDEDPGLKKNEIKQYVIHVLNPYLFFKTSPRFKLFLKKLFSNNAFKTIIGNIQIAFNLPFDMAVKILVDIITNMVTENPDGSSIPWQEAMNKIREINDTTLNIVVLEDQKQNHPYIKEQLVNISYDRVMSFDMMHKNNFGENTIWKKLHGFHRWVKK
ncbi:MAG: hypothetical protein JSV88_08970 [Candidatus Aminicenantes bacterium]|nr:MAG: hypothetical protein JSV88_08970 [Candidatus Aminicenantes bacterium]